MTKLKSINIRMRFTLSECDVGMRKLFLELQQIEASTNDESEVNQKKKIHLLHILHAYCQNKSFGEVASPFQIEVHQQAKELTVVPKAIQHMEVSNGTSTAPLGIDAMQALFNPTFGD